ncbi:hypothetical protein Tco_0041868, partial [Tanacetum coccineum]
KEEHEVHVKLVLESLRKEKLYAKFSKCESWYGYIRNYKKTVKNEQARTRESEEYKKKPKNKSREQSLSQIQSKKS